MVSQEEDYPKHDVVVDSIGLAKVCTWSLHEKKENPHTSEVRDYTMKIKDSILDCVGNTPLVRINNITKAEGIECEVLVKCEFMNPAGSVKDRIARRMVLDAEKDGRIKPGDVLVEPTSGNTGMGIACCAAARGYKAIITMPEKMSQEKIDALKGLGATIVRTPTEYGRLHLHSYMGVAFTLGKEIPNARVLNQYAATGNPMSHYDETGQEIWDQTEGRLDYVIMGVGTGGTITGIARKLKENDPTIQVIGVDPPGSVLAADEKMNADNPAAPGGQVIEGTGYDFLPKCYDQNVVDGFIKGPDKESFIMARRLMREEGLMCGGSSGQAFWGAIEYIKQNKIGKGKRVVVVLADGIRNYMTKHLNADWMYERGYITEEECTAYNTDTLLPCKDWGQDMKVKDLALKEVSFMKITDTCEEALRRMKETGFEQFPVKDEQGVTYGQITNKGLLTRLFKKHVGPQDSIKRAVTRDLRTVSMEMNLNELCRVLIRTNLAVVEDKYVVELSDLLAKFSPDVIVKMAEEEQPAVEAQPVVEAPTPIVQVEVAPVVVAASKKEDYSSSSTTGRISWTALGVMMGAGAALLMSKHN